MLKGYWLIHLINGTKIDNERIKYMCVNTVLDTYEFRTSKNGEVMCHVKGARLECVEWRELCD